MSPIVLAFSGAIGSGKSTISVALATRLGWPRTSFGDHVRDEAVRRRVDPTSRDALQALGEQLIAEGWEPLCRAVLNRVNWEPLIVDGIRHTRALDTLRGIVAPMPVRLVYLDADAATRALRLQNRARGQESDPTLTEKHSTEIEVTSQLPALADYITATDREVTAITEEIVGWLGRA